MIEFLQENVIFAISTVLLIGAVAGASALKNTPGPNNGAIDGAQSADTSTTAGTTTNSNSVAAPTLNTPANTNVTPTVNKPASVSIPIRHDLEEERETERNDE